MVRGTGKYKQKRGGGRSFSKNLEFNENGIPVTTDKWSARGQEDSDDDSEEESSEESEEESEEEAEEGAAGTAGASTGELTRAERKALKSAQKKKPAAVAEEEEDGDDPLLANPNHTAGKALKLSEIEQTREPSRREREAQEKKDAQERYWKLHEQGKTDQAKADLARLQKIRAEREAAAARRKAEAESKATEAEAKKKAQKAGR